MTLKKPAKLIAIAGACAVAVALPTSLALPGSFGPEADSDPEAAQSAAGVVAQPEPEPELPVGNAENALTSEEGEQVVDGETQASTDDGSSRVVDMIVQLKDGTDTAAALRGAEMNCDVMLKATNVDGVYTADPKKDPSATRYETITFDEALLKNLKVMDATAFALCRERKLNIVVFGIAKEGSLKRVVTGENEGTLVHC